MKLELVLTVWKDGLFKSRDRIEADNTDGLMEQLQIVLDNMTDDTHLGHSHEVVDDDDIPF